LPLHWVKPEVQALVQDAAQTPEEQVWPVAHLVLSSTKAVPEALQTPQPKGCDGLQYFCCTQ